MIQSLTNMIKLRHFFQNDEQNQNFKRCRKRKPFRLIHSISTLDAEIKDLCTLITSQQQCQNWLILIQKHKENYTIKETLYNAIRNSTITVHNLFLMAIQYRVLPPQVWIPIQWLCKLKGDHDNQLCCLIHFTILNMGKKYQFIHNPQKWSKQKGEQQMGINFQKIYNNPQMSLQQKIAILPMLIVLNNKNSSVLWSRLKWLYSFPHLIIFSLHSNISKLLQQRSSNHMRLQNHDYFTSKMCIKSIQLLEVQGFISAKNLFTYSYQLYNISMLLQLLASYTSVYNDEKYSYRLLLIDFIVQLFQCIQLYQYQFDYTDGINNKDMVNIRQIIIKNKLYLQQLGDMKFNQQIQGLINQYQWNHGNINTTQTEQSIEQQLNIANSSKMKKATKSLQNWLITSLKPNQTRTNHSNNPPTGTTLARIIPRCSSQQWFNQNTMLGTRNQGVCYSNQNHNGQKQQIYEQQLVLKPLSAEQKLSKFTTQKQQTILTHILSQLYQLKPQYLQMLSSILYSCYNQNDQQPWSQINSSFYKLQLYLMKNYLLEFLVYNFNSLETKNNAITMINYYSVFGFILRGNPISYGRLDRILSDIEQQGTGSAVSQKNKLFKTHQCKLIKKQCNISNTLQYFSISFLNNIALLKPTILIILSDQFEWKQNELQNYPNFTYQSIFIRKVIEERKVQWMVIVIECICCLYLNEDIQKFPKKDRYKKQTKSSNQFPSKQNKQLIQIQNEKFQWVTMLLVLYYYFEQTIKITKQNLKTTQKLSIQKQKIKVPNKASLDKIFEKQMFMQKLYPSKIKIISGYDHDNLPLYKLQRKLILLLTIMDQWEQFYNHNSKKNIICYGLSYPMLKIFKKKLKNRISLFVKAKQYQQKGQLLFNSRLIKKNYQEK